MIRFLGRTLAFPADAEALRSRLEDWWHFPEAAEAASSEWRVQVEPGGDRVPETVRAARFEDAQLGLRYRVESATSFWLLDGDCGVRGLVGSKGATITLYGEPFAGWIALRWALGEAFSASGLICLHAAAIARRDRVIALLGPSGTGKSTTLVRALAAGWRPIAEDLAWLDPSSLRLFGTDRRLRLLPDSAELLAELRPDVELAPRGGIKLEVPFEHLGGRVSGRRLSEIALLRRRPGAPSEWRPLSAAEGVMALYQATGVPYTEANRRFLATALGELVARVRPRVLQLGDTELPLGEESC